MPINHEKQKEELTRLSLRGRFRSRIITIIPLIGFIFLAAIFLQQLRFGDQSSLPSALVGKRIPNFTLPSLEGADKPGFSNLDLSNGKPSIVNVFASWCGPCREEHPILTKLSIEYNFEIYGINQRDSKDNALRFLEKYGNPYKAVGVDSVARVSIDWGVYGVPETFIVSGKGIIIEKIVGPLTDEIIEEKIIPIIRRELDIN